MSSNSKNVDFDGLLSSPEAYDKSVGEWWKDRSLDKDHQQAYQIIAQKAYTYYKENNLKEPKLIVDYACGNGIFIKHLLDYFPNSSIVGIDGAKNLLNQVTSVIGEKYQCAEVPPNQAFDQEGPQIKLISTYLPDFNFPKHQADLAFLCFPNLIPSEEMIEVFNDNGYGHEDDVPVAEMLARFREMDPEDETVVHDKDELFDELLTARVFSLNLRHFLKADATLLRVDYANANRDELSQLTQWRSAFSECALAEKIKDEKSRQFFELKHSSYHPSNVILDVYHQTLDETDKEGGFAVNIFSAK